MIIDTESHVLYRLFPREMNPRRSPVLRTSWHEYSGDLFAAEMERAGVTHAFLISYDAEDILWYLRMHGGTIEDFVGGRKFTLAAVRSHPDKFFWFSTLKDPRRPEAMTLLDQDIADGALGVKIFPAYLGLSLADPALMAVYRKCLEANRRVVVSLEDTRPPRTPDVREYFLQLDKVLTEFKDLRAQINHAGAGGPHDPASDPLNREAEIVFRVATAHDNLLVSTAWLASKWDDESEYPFPQYLRRLERLVDAIGVDRLAWASDWPWLDEYMTYPQAVNCIARHASFLTEAEKAALLGRNAWLFIEDLLPAYERAPIFAGLDACAVPPRRTGGAA